MRRTKLLCRAIAVLFLLTACLGVCACSSDSSVDQKAYKALREFVHESVGVGRGMMLLTNDHTDKQVFFYLKADKSTESGETVAETGKEPLHLSMLGLTGDGKVNYRIDLVLDPETPNAMVWKWQYADRKLGQVRLIVETTLDPATFTGKDPMPFDDLEVVQVPETEAGTEAATETAEDTTPVPLPGENETAPSVEGIIAGNEDADYARNDATKMTTFALRVMDEYCYHTIGYDLDDFGFTAMASEFRYDPNAAAQNAETTVTADLGDILDPATMTLSTARLLPLSVPETETSDATATETTESTPADSAEDTTLEATESVTETEDDLGPAFSGERLSYAGRMTLLGMGMVFAVLGFLWAVLSIFKRIFYGKTPKEPRPAKKEAEPTPAPTPAPVPAPVAPAGDDPAIIAAITAAIAAMIESDPDLSAEFIDGFRVVSFKKKSGKTSWNQ